MRSLARFRPLLALLALAAPVGAQRGERLGTDERVAFEVRPTSVAFGAIATGEVATEQLVVRNRGLNELVLESVAFELGTSGNAAAFTLELDGATFPGGAGSASYSTAVVIPPRGQVEARLAFAPTREQYDTPLLLFGFGGPRGGVAEVQLAGLGGHEGDPYMHPVLAHPALVVDYDGDGHELVLLDASESHTHEPGRSIVDWSFALDGGAPQGGGPTALVEVPRWGHLVHLTVTDDGAPARTSSLETRLDVVPSNAIPGVLARTFEAPPGGATAMIDALPPGASWVEVVPTLRLDGAAGIGSSPYVGDVVVELMARVWIPVAGQYRFGATGGATRRLEVDGAPVVGPLALAPGTVDVAARFAVDSLADLPLVVRCAYGSNPPIEIPAVALRHSEQSLVPILNECTPGGTTLGGNEVVLSGLGFFPVDAVTVHFGALALGPPELDTVGPDEIRFTSPAHAAGPVDVRVETPAGLSNARTFLYDDGGPVPIRFVVVREVSIPQPTAGAWGPDGKLYVAALDGRISVLTFADDWSLSGLKQHAGVSGLANGDTLGVAFDPYDAVPRVHVAHGQHFVDGGGTPPGPSPYTGAISVLTGPDFSSPAPLLSGLPSSNHDHAPNGLAFDASGDLYVNLGSNTNAGVQHPNSGDLPESPLAGAVVRARLSEPGFDGHVGYELLATGVPSTDQRDGEDVVLADDRFVSVYAPGVRNALGLVWTTQERLYATDNGPNLGFGAASTGPASEDPDPYDSDELLLIERGNYYGHPNRCRARTDPRQYVYRPSSSGSSIAGEFTQALSWLPSSSNGLVEYRADAFRGALRGDLIAQKWNSEPRRVDLTEDGLGVLGVSPLGVQATGLSLVTGPGGALLLLDYSTNKVRVLVPDDVAAGDLEVYDVTPWRAPAAGGTRFVIGGVGFGTQASTSVTFGGLPATLTRVSPTRIEGLVPPNPTPTTELLDVVVVSGGRADTLTRGFRYLLGRGAEPGRWDPLPELPRALGEVGAAEIDGILFVLGEGATGTYAFDLLTRSWLGARAQRPYPGHHHAVEVIGGELYVVGGLEGGSEGRLQVYDPVLDAWRVGADMPWAGGSLSTAVIDGKVYAAGGIVSTWTVNNTAVYDPVLDAWTPLAPMPSGRNHAAAGTDGELFYVIGGRRGGNFVGPGYGEVMVYDPLANTWASSADPGSPWSPLPVPRGGVGRAVFLEGELYVFGGETPDHPDADPGTHVFDRVDVFDPVTGTWRTEAPMPVGRHGLSPVRFEGKIFVPGGGTQAGWSQSRIFDVFRFD